MRKLLALSLLFLFIFSQIGYCYDYTQDANCQGAWLFKEGTGTTVDDSSANSNVGNFASDGHPAWYNTILPAAYTTWAAKFIGGTSDYINVGNDASLNITGNLTIVAWMNYVDQTGFGLFGGYLTSSPYNGYCFGLGSINYKMNFWDSANWVSANTIINWNGWYHTAISISGTTASFFLNGAGDGTPTVQAPASFTGNRYIGVRNSALEAPINGKLTEVAVFNRALTSTEINDIKDNGLVGGAPALDDSQLIMFSKLQCLNQNF